MKPPPRSGDFPGTSFPVRPPQAPTPIDWDARLNRPQPADKNGDWWEGAFRRPAWTPRGFLIRGDRLMLKCRACSREAVLAPAQALVDAGKGDIPWSAYKGQWKCECKSKDIEVSLDLAQDRKP